jgi:hypothetical protein
MFLNKFIRITASVAAAALLMAVIIPAFKVDALSTSSLRLSDSRPNATGVNYAFTSSGFNTSTTINCIQLDIGTAVNGTGDAGLTIGGATLVSNTITGSGWTVGAVEGTDQLRATNGTGSAPSASGSIEWGGIVNGATPDVTYFGLFQTFSNVDCTSGGPIDSVVVTLIFKSGSLVSLTIDPTLTFTVAGVASSQTINGIATTITTTSTAVNFLNAVTASSNGVSAHDLTASTNATGGYSLYIRHTGLLTSGANTIDNWTGTNSTPTAFPAAGTEAWGYTTNDSTLNSGTPARFTTGPSWAGFSDTTNELVGDSSGPIGTTTTRVGHQVGVSASTEAGTYQTTIIYTAASIY